MEVVFDVILFLRWGNVAVDRLPQRFCEKLTGASEILFW